MSNELQVFVDGGSRGNPGQAAIGGVFLVSEQVVREFSHYLGIATNNEAEYRGLLQVLELLPEVLAQHNGVEQVVIHMDSKLVVEQVSGNWKIKEPRLQVLAQEAQGKIRNLSVAVRLTHVPRKLNAAADALVNQCLDSQSVENK